MSSLQQPKMKIAGKLLVLLLCFTVATQSCIQFRTSDKKAQDYFNSKNQKIEINYLEVGNRNLHYVITGNKKLPTLFFVHGSPGSWDAFKIYLADTILQQHFRIISIDRPGFGYSDFRKAMPLEGQAKLIFEIIKKEDNQQPIHLIGHSIGGPVIMKLAQNHPESYASITSLAGSISPHDEPRELWRYPFTYFPLQFLLPGAFRPSNREIVFFKKELVELDKHYDQLTMPVTFIHGDQDQLVTVKNVAYGEAKLAGNSQVNTIIIPGANHFIPWQHFDIIKKHLLTLDRKTN
tara:strand:- start:414 stop:1289 length:876 start_codon:yes stop_codon:yes gene_type:complete